MAHLVGRADELAVIAELLARPGLRIAEIVGEPGIGKTRLLAEIRAAAGPRRALAGQAGELAGSIPYSVLVDALDDTLTKSQPPLTPQTQTLLTDILPALTPPRPSPANTPPSPTTPAHGDASPTPSDPLRSPTLDAPPLSAHAATEVPSRGIPEFHASREHRQTPSRASELSTGAGNFGVPPGVPSGGIPEFHVTAEGRQNWGGEGQLSTGARFWVHQALGEVLEWLATPDGLVLTLDDMHWADEATSELLGHLIRRPPDAPLLIVLAYRPRQQPRHLAAALAGTHSEVIELEPLSRDQTAELLGPDVSQHRLNRLYELSGGNPLYLDALSKVGTASSFDAVLTAELDRLRGPARRVAHAAAVLDDPFDQERTAEVSELSTADTRKALAELQERDFIRPDGGKWRFRHPLVRRAAYNAASRGWLHGAHARAAKALREAPATKQAPHVMRVAQVGDEQAVELLAKAAAETITHGPATAAQWLRAAADLIPDTATTRRLQLLAELGNALALSGSLHESREVLQNVLHQLPADAYRSGAVVLCARVEQLLGRHPEARGLLLAELKRMPENQRRERAFLELELGSVGLISCDFQIDTTWIADALAIAKDLNDRALEAGAYAVLALAAYGVADVATALEWQRKGAALLDELTDDELAWRVDVTATLGWAELYLAQPRQGLMHLDRGLALSARTGHSHQLIYLLTGKAMAQHLMGDLIEAGATAAEAVEAAELSASEKLKAAAYTIQAMVATSRRERDLALKAGQRAARASAENPDWWAAVAGCALGSARLINGDAEGCLADLVRLAGGPDLPLLDPLHRPVFGEPLVVAELSRGRIDNARAWIAMMEQAVEESNGGESLPNRTGHIALCRARLELVAGEANQAVEHATTAVRAFGGIDHTLQEAESREVLGSALAAAGHPETAIAELTETAKQYSAFGLPGRRDGVYRKLRALGHNVIAPRSAEARGTLPELTAREDEVARLVAEGLTNREIMQRLQLSRRTVETHITNIRLKLDVASRAALAARVIRAG
ncbi:AAA family ATPase [Actinocrispum sp. NPDC049592]|uniref:AAA family ATPase n=1 Tax=Actinocrispum sp. NPDC049592 TaxID=3154835 RepID=UPI00341E5F6C